MGRAYDLDMLTQDLTDTWNENMKAELAANKASSDISISCKNPSRKIQKESLTTYLLFKNSQDLIPLAYIIREYDDPLSGVIYQTVHDELVAYATLQVPEFNTNNGIIDDLLQSLTLNGPAWSRISTYLHFRDGRNAWKTYINYYKGDAMKTHSKQECNEAIAKASTIVLTVICFSLLCHGKA